jgi:hypothetical protein
MYKISYPINFPIIETRLNQLKKLEYLLSIEEIRKQIGLRKLGEFEEEKVVSTILDNYKIAPYSINYFHPFYNYFTNCIEDNRTFNNDHRLIKIVKKYNRVDAIGYFAKILVRTNYRKSYYTKVFIKEIPLLSFSDLLKFREINQVFSPESYRIYNSLFSINTSANNETFISYLVSKLTEQHIAPTFPIMYLSTKCTLDKFSKELKDPYEVMVAEKYRKEYTDRIKIYFNEEINMVQITEMPVYLLATEKLEVDIYNYFAEYRPNTEEVLSVMFQVLFGIFVMNRVFGIVHNDLHSSNIMFQGIEDKYYYYKVGKKFYRVPTFHKQFKIIDFGRAIFNIEGIKSNNEIFSTDGDAFGQYYFPKLGSKKEVKLPKSQYDIAYFILSLLRDMRVPKKLKGILEMYLVNTNGEMLDYDNENFSTIEDMSNQDFNLDAYEILKSKLFKRWEVSLDQIPEDVIIYGLK